MHRPLLRGVVVLSVAVSSMTCKDDEPSAASTENRPVGEPSKAAPVAADNDHVGGEDSGWDEGWPSEANVDATEPEPEPVGDTVRGPCRIQWDDGRKITFRYTTEGAEVFVDSNGDGENDTCETFKNEDGRPTYVRVDNGCDRKTDLTIRLKHEKDVNLASASISGSGPKREMALVVLPSFTGVMPGYPLEVTRRRVELTIEDGLVMAAKIPKGDGRPVKNIGFTYDASRRIADVREDLAADGSVDSQFGYTYDDAGNLTQITRTIGTQRTMAKLSYTCWQKTKTK